MRYCFEYNDSIRIHYERDDSKSQIKHPYGPCWISEEGPQGPRNEWHICDLDKESLSEEEINYFMDKYQPLLELYFPKCDFEGHLWGNEFELKGKISKACRYCGTIVGFHS